MRWLVLLAVLLAFVFPASAAANHAAVASPGFQTGVLMPRDVADVRVDRELLEFELEGCTARVTATYHMTNVGTDEHDMHVAFVFEYLGQHPWRFEPPEARVSVDDSDVEYRFVSDGEVFAALLAKFVDEHPQVRAALDSMDAPSCHAWDDGPLRAALREVGTDCSERCESLPLALEANRMWYPQLYGSDDRFEKGAREILPAEHAELLRAWSGSGDAGRLGWFLFAVRMAPGQSRKVVVGYEQVAEWTSLTQAEIPCTFHYLLSPARHWASFGELEVRFRAPYPIDLAANIPLQRDGDQYRAVMASLPVDKLEIRATRMDRVWFGMTSRSSYWAILFGAIGLGSAAIGVALAFQVSRRVRWWTVGIGIVLSAVLPIPAGVGIAEGLYKAFPPLALGSVDPASDGYEVDPSPPRWFLEKLPKEALFNHTFAELYGLYLTLLLSGPLAAAACGIGVPIAVRRSRRARGRGVR